MVIDVDNSQSGFRLQVRVRHGATYREKTTFARRLTDYLDEREFQHSGGPLLMWLTGYDRELSSTDPLDLAFWLLFDTLCVGVRISDLGQLAGEHGFVDVEALDFCVFALTLVYSLHRVTADQVIDMLGGFMCRTDPEEGCDGRPARLQVRLLATHAGRTSHSSGCQDLWAADRFRPTGGASAHTLA